MTERVFQFVAAAADIFFFGCQFDSIVRASRVAGFAGGMLIDLDLTGHDGALGFLAAFTQAAFHEDLVEAWHGRREVGRVQPKARRCHSGFRAPDSAFIQALPWTMRS